MKRGGGVGGGGAAAVAGVKAIANVLGISRQEVSQYTQQSRNEPAPLFPPLAKDPLPLEESKELTFMTDAKQEFLHRFHESQFYHKKTGKRDVKRYTDKYRLMDKAPFEPHWDRLPAEINWRSTAGSSRNKPTKRRRLDENRLLDELGRREERTADKESEENEEEAERIGEDDDDENAPRPKVPLNEDEEEADYSDEDYLNEGANDYVDTYFDDGEGYDDEGNALDDEGAY